MNPQESTENQGISQAVSAEVSAQETQNCIPTPTLDPALETLIEAWPRLPGAIRAAIAAMVGAVESAGGKPL